MTPGEMEEAIARELTARGVRAQVSAAWTVQGALDVAREQRRRYAHTPQGRRRDILAGRLAEELAEASGVAPRDISVVLLMSAGMLGGLAVLNDLPGAAVADLMAAAADDLDQLATTTDPTEGSPCQT